jgi:hypothetical protein
MKIPIPHNYYSYPWQQEPKKRYEQGIRRIYKVWHRRGGKDLNDLNEFLVSEGVEIPGTYYYIWPTLKQGRDIFWEGKDEQGNDIRDYYIPKEIIYGNPDNQDMKLTLRCPGISATSTIQVIGTDQNHYLKMRGRPCQGAVLSEFAYQDHRALDVVRPMITKTGGWIVFNTTPNGNNHAKILWDTVRTLPDWYCDFKTIDDTYDHKGNRLITKESIEKERQSGMSDDMIQQEYYCSWVLGVEGSYYGRLIQEARTEGRIGALKHDKALSVYTGWDIGIGDYTAIWFAQLLGNEIRIIDYHENTGQPMAQYIRLAKEKDYLYETHFMPPDIEAREWTSGIRRKEAMEQQGLKHISVNEIISKDYQHELVRAALPRCIFDEEKCKLGIERLTNYHKHYNNLLECYTNDPEHDINSHGADAFAQLIMGIKLLEMNSSINRGYSDAISEDYVKKHSIKYVGL